MIPSGIDRRIFVVGVPRSGTTLVQSLLAAHSKVASFTESHFFSRHFFNHQRKRLSLLSSLVPILIRHPLPRVREFLTENDATSSENVAEILTGLERLPPAPLLPLRSRAVARRLLQLLDELALRQDASTWVEKTPGHLPYIPFLERLSTPDRPMDFVHVVRDGLEVVASLHKASQNWERPYDLDTCVRRWNMDLGMSLRRVGKDHFVFYEELTARPEATMQRLLLDLDLPWEPEILDRYAESSRQLITPDETWKANVDRKLRPSATSKLALSEEQRKQVASSLQHDLYTRLRAYTAS